MRVTFRCLLVASLALGAACGGGGNGGDGARSGDVLPRHFLAHPAFERARYPLVVGHGGAKHLCAENTLPCYRLALRRGADALEADLQLLGDGTLVMFDAPRTADQTGVDRALAGIDLATARTLDLGWGFTPDGGATHPSRGRGIHISTLREFLDAFPSTPVLLDVKPESDAMARALLDFVRRELSDEERERVYIETDDQALADRLRALDAPPRVALTSGERAELLVLVLLGSITPDLDRLPPGWIDLDAEVPVFDATLALVAAWAREHGHVLTVGTVNDETTMRHVLADTLADGQVTDRPDLLAPLREPFRTRAPR